MLKKRVIPILLYQQCTIVKSKKFNDFRNVGNAISSSKIYYSQDADELIILNIDRKYKDINELERLVRKISEVVFLPITVGGGINTLDDACKIISAGADKIVVNSAVYEDYNIISEIGNIFGAQAVVVAIDLKKHGNEYYLYSKNGTTRENISFEEHIRKSEIMGVGEFLIQSIDHDGCMEGFDIELLKKVCNITNRPVIGCGGSGSYEDVLECFMETRVQAVACGSLFNFSDSSPVRAAAFLKNLGIDTKAV